jgi:hypothetical protein
MIITSAFQSYYFFFDRFNNQRYPPTLNNLEKRLIFAHLLKNNEYFTLTGDAQERCLINIFENENRQYRFNQTIRIRLLQGLMQFGRTVSLKQLSDYILSVFDYDPQEIVNALRAFIRAEVVSVKNLLHPSFDIAVLKDQLSEAHLGRNDIHIGISHCGKLHHRLLQNKNYIEIMKFSTFVLQKELQIIQGDSSRKLPNTKKQTLLFLQYLAAEEKREIECGIRDVARFNADFGKVIPLIIESVVVQFRLIESQGG